MIHHLKQNIQFWNDMVSGKKPFEIRKNDRNFKVGDILYLKAVGPCCHYCDGTSFKSYYNGICKGWQNCYENDANQYKLKIIEIVEPTEYNSSDKDPKIDSILKDFFNSDVLMDEYVILKTEPVSIH